jgi:hypothetical protein
MSYETVEKWIEQHRSELNLKCWRCGRPFFGHPTVYGYSHDDGYPIIGCTHPVWLYVVCEDVRCGYYNTLVKLGVPPGTVF